MSTMQSSTTSAVARTQGKSVEAWLRAQALAAGFTPRKIDIERDFANEGWRIYGFDREGERRVMHVPAYQAEEMFDDRLQEQTEYYLRKAQHKMQTDMEREMANVWTNNTLSNWTTTGTSTNTTTDYFQWNQSQGLGALGQQQQYAAERARLQQEQYFVTKSNGIGIRGERKPKDFREELQLELDDYLKDVLH